MFIWFSGALGLFLMLSDRLAWPLLLHVIIALNASTFIVYGYDKACAIIKARRVPERVLQFFAFAGGPIGAIAAMQIFRHKTRKVGFQFVLAVLILLELAIVYAVLTPLVER